MLTSFQAQLKTQNVSMPVIPGATPSIRPQFSMPHPWPPFPSIPATPYPLPPSISATSEQLPQTSKRELSNKETLDLRADPSAGGLFNFFKRVPREEGLEQSRKRSRAGAEEKIAQLEESEERARYKAAQERVSKREDALQRQHVHRERVREAEIASGLRSPRGTRIKTPTEVSPVRWRISLCTHNMVPRP